MEDRKQKVDLESRKWRIEITKKLPVVLVVIVAVFAARYLLLSGFVPTHDGEYHIVRFWQFDKVFRSGNLLPRWAPDLDQSRGVPLFSFFYPLPNYIAEIFILFGFSYVKSLHLVLASGLVVSGITFYLWMRTLFKAWPSAVGAIFYILAPYHLVDVFIRGSVGEVWALALAPLVLFLTTEMILRLKRNARACQVNRVIALNSVSILLLLLSHNILGPVFFVFALLYGLVITLWVRAHKDKTGGIIRNNIKVLIYNLKPLLASYALGFMFSCFFWLPVIFDRKYVEGLNIIDISNHFPQVYQLLIPSWGTGFSGISNLSDQMSFQIGVPHLLVVFCVSLLLTLRLRSKYLPRYEKSDFLLAGFMLFVFFGAVGLMLRVSEPLWNSVKPMQYFQYPWRLLSAIIVSTSFLSAFAANLKPKILIPLLLLLALLFYLPYTKPVVYPARTDAFYLENPIWAQGTATLGDSFGLKQNAAKKEIDNSNARKIGNLISLTGLAIVFFFLIVQPYSYKIKKKFNYGV